jgi:ATP-dependent Lon protease
MSERNDQEPGDEGFQLPESLPLLPVRDVVVFPYMILPLFVGREASLRAVETAMAGDRMIMLATQKDFSEDDPAPDGIFKVGTAAMIRSRTSRSPWSSSPTRKTCRPPWRWRP